MKEQGKSDRKIYNLEYWKLHPISLFIGRSYPSAGNTVYAGELKMEGRIHRSFSFSPPPFFFFFRRNFVVSRFALDLFMRVSFLLLLLPLFSLSLSSSNRIQDRFAGGTRRIQYFSSRISRPFPPPPLIFRMHLGGLSSIPSRRQLQTRRPINVSGGGIWAKSRGERFLPAKLRVNDSPPSVNRLIDPPPQQLINQPFNRAFFPSLVPFALNNVARLRFSGILSDSNSEFALAIRRQRRTIDRLD